MSSIRVLHYQRRRRAKANFSLEFIFADVRNRLRDQCEIEVRSAPFFSNGLVRRCAITLDVWRHQLPITHITGDINFAVLGTKRNSAVLTILDCGFLNRRQGFARTILKKLWLDWPVQHAGVVTTISEAIKQEIVQFSGCKPEKVVVIPVAISEAFQPHSKPFDASCPRILCIGTAFNKNTARVIQAVEGMSCKLVIIGNLSEELQQQLAARQVAYENYVELTSAQVLEQYHLSDIVCFPSLYEGFGMPILEAQAVGRPVLTGNTSSMPEVAGTAACIIDPKDVVAIRNGLQAILNDASYREDLVAKGFENVKRFEPQGIAQKYLEVYRSLM